MKFFISIQRQFSLGRIERREQNILR